MKNKEDKNHEKWQHQSSKFLLPFPIERCSIKVLKSKAFPSSFKFKDLQSPSAVSIYHFTFPLQFIYITLTHTFGIHISSCSDENTDTFQILITGCTVKRALYTIKFSFKIVQNIPTKQKSLMTMLTYKILL